MSALISNNFNQGFNNILVPDVLSGWPTASTPNGSNLYPNPRKQVASLENSILETASLPPNPAGQSCGAAGASSPSCFKPFPTPHPPGKGRAAIPQAIHSQFHESGLSSIDLAPFCPYKRMLNIYKKPHSTSPCAQSRVGKGKMVKEGGNKICIFAS